MKLKDIKNDGVFKEKDITSKSIDFPQGKIAYNQAKEELSEAELVVDDKKIEKVVRVVLNHLPTRDGYFLVNPNKDATSGDIVKALTSSISEWLKLERRK